MNKFDMILIITIMIMCGILMIPIYQSSPVSDDAVVKYKTEEKMRINLDVDETYTVEGTLGPVTIEVKDNAVRVTQENSPHHYCSEQGFVSSPNTPIVCLPNDIVVTIEGHDDEEMQEDTVIQ